MAAALASERPARAAAGTAEFELAGVKLADGAYQNTLSVPDMHCGGCVHRIESMLGDIEGIDRARANLTTRRVNIVWRDSAAMAKACEALDRLGYANHLHEIDAETADPEMRRLLKAVGVAGFAAANIMMLSFAVWAGADTVSRDWLHIVSGLIAAPALAYSGRIFLVSAWRGLRKGHANMDLPISIAIVLTFALSVVEVATGGAHAYFDAATMLVFFLLVGRALDFAMRDKARTSVRGLASLSPRGATRLLPDGGSEYVAVDELAPRDRIRLAAGERVPVNARVVDGISDIDVSLVTGESLPVRADAGTALFAGAMNLTGPLELQVEAPARESFLAEMTRLVELAETGRGRLRRLADSVAAYYAPLVHFAALATFMVWWLQTGDVHRAVVVAISVLIITCPCALGLAVPMVQVVAAGRLFARGILIKDGSALERLPQADTVVFDKTGTLTEGVSKVASVQCDDDSALDLAASLAVRSDHPNARAIAGYLRGLDADVRFDEISEVAGFGMEARIGQRVYRLGRPEWSGGPTAESGHTVLSRDDQVLARFRFDDALRPEAGSVVQRLRALGMRVALLSGDHPDNVTPVAETLDISEAFAGQTPQEKLAYLQRLRSAAARPIMVGDGLNDAAALAAAHVSIAPATAADINRRAADMVFLHGDLNAIPIAIEVGRRAASLIRQNIGLAIAYNAIAVPIAMSGHVTPAIAAICMSASSLVVVANSLRLRERGAGKRPRARSATLAAASP